jgi:nucleoside-diphosphate-sugar epimerase
LTAVTITGGSGFVGQLVRRDLASEGFRVEVFDRFRGRAVDLVRRQRLIRGRVEPLLAKARVIRPTRDDILGDRDELAARFAGSHAVIHLAGIPHPHVPGATDDDFIRMNYDGAVNVFEAARAAGVRTFVFASSAQVYGINDPVRLDRLPLSESNYLPHPAEGQTTYGFLKASMERYLAGACATGSTQAISLRLESPGMQSTSPTNMYVSSSVENLVAGFRCALSAPAELGFEAFNIADGETDPGIVDIQAYVRHRWPYVPNDSVGNACLLGTEKARRLLGYRPVQGGGYAG